MALKGGTKYIFVTGGVMSGLGKGITAASIGKVLKSRGLKVNIQKCDPYLNPDAGTLNPAEHGEVFVTADGAETDLDLGHYERFLDQELSGASSLMSGEILLKLISEERAGKYLGKTVQVVPHLTSAIQDAIQTAGAGFDVHIVEIGGTVGDYESPAFFEAIRAMRYRVGRNNVLYVHVVYLPYLPASKEVKTKPAQNAVRNLRSLGIAPDALVARTDHFASPAVIQKLSVFCDVEVHGIALVPTVENVYTIPVMLEDSGMGQYITGRLNLKKSRSNLREWKKTLETARDKKLPALRIGVVAKYLDNEDTYRSVFEALRAASWSNKIQAEIAWVDAEKLEKAKNLEVLEKFDGIVVPGGFGSRGVEGKIKAAQYALKHRLPYLGLCLGMQVAVVGLARNVVSSDSHSTEINPDTKNPVISLMADQSEITDKGGTMRLGNYTCVLDKASKSRGFYGQKEVQERHRHRYEFNNAYREALVAKGMRLAGLSPDGKLVELIEMDNHPFFVGSQFHPEFKSRPDRPHSLFNAFIKASKDHR